MIFGVLLLATAVFAEPPFYHQQRQYYFERQQEDPSAAAPYPARGWKPSGPSFDLPERQQTAIQQQYGAPETPQQQYGPPQKQYGAPEQQYGAPQQQYGAPEQQYGAPAAPQQQYRKPVAQKQTAAPQQQYGAPEQQYGAPATPQQQNRKPAPQRQIAAPQQQYGAPEQQYGAPAATQQQYRRPTSQRQVAAPQQQYGAPAAPQQQYGAPQNQYEQSTPQRQIAVPQQQYGAPNLATTTEIPSSTEFDEETTAASASSTEAEFEPVNSVNELDDQEAGNAEQRQNQQTGEYYVALPDGRLQKVSYVSRQDVEAMKYFAKVQAENVEPLRGPIYAYSPLQKLRILPAGLELAVSPAVPVEPTRAEKLNAESPKLETQVQPVAAQVQYQLDNPAGVVPIARPVSSSYTTYTANYQIPAADSRLLLTIQ
ncbi:uncharacterized protein [Prorops nasuta]|uniref:uncharacterized protein n=1 Tax=Prorops nasuta TaxID=863751 RepID=UPI0034CE2903